MPSETLTLRLTPCLRPANDPPPPRPCRLLHKLRHAECVPRAGDGVKQVLDLFSGAGGMSLGLERACGFATAAFCEIEPFAQGILRKHWPGVPIYDDIATADFSALGPVDVVTAGFPCQDISFAGKGAGLAGERSGLFWHVIRTAGLVGWPKLLLENVAGLLNRGMGEVLGALAEVGYDAEWHCIPASAVGAPHRRDRVWIVADPKRDQQSREKPCVRSFGRMGGGPAILGVGQRLARYTRRASRNG